MILWNFTSIATQNGIAIVHVGKSPRIKVSIGTKLEIPRFLKSISNRGLNVVDGCDLIW